MNKKIYFFAMSLVLMSQPCFAAEKEVFKDILFSEDIKTEKTADIGKSDAGKILDSAPQKIEIEGVKLPTRRQRETISDEELLKYGEAPFGLNWGTSQQYVRNNNGVLLTDIGGKDNVRSYSASMLPKSIPDFDMYILNFGFENKLWNIIAHGRSIDDDKQGTKILEEYNKYVRLLGQKYNTKKEYFTPKTSIVEETKRLPNGRDEITKKEVKSKIGDETFVEDIKNGDASLYSTFTDGNVGVVLTINVDKGGKTYLTLDYKRIKLIKERESKTLEAI
ncbi:MAG: hypothetical protein ACK5N8_05615 [Alphaproteobacteria bacterium]